MLGDIEGHTTRDAPDHALELFVLERDHLAAVVTDEMVMMVGAVGVDGLVAGDPLADLDARDELEPLELVEHTVDACPRHLTLRAAQRLLDLQRRQRTRLAGEQIDDRATGPASTVARVGEAARSLLGPRDGRELLSLYQRPGRHAIDATRAGNGGSLRRATGGTDGER